MNPKGLYPLASAIPKSLKTPLEKLTYLKTHKVEGVLIDDLLKWREWRKLGAMAVMKDWLVSPSQMKIAVLKCAPVRTLAYSLRPDRFPGSHNCVTWCIEIINRSLEVGDLLPEIPSGNITLMKKHLQTRQVIRKQTL